MYLRFAGQFMCRLRLVALPRSSHVNLLHQLVRHSFLHWDERGQFWRRVLDRIDQLEALVLAPLLPFCSGHDERLPFTGGAPLAIIPLLHARGFASCWCAAGSSATCTCLGFLSSSTDQCAEFETCFCWFALEGKLIDLVSVVSWWR